MVSSVLTPLHIRKAHGLYYCRVGNDRAVCYEDLDNFVSDFFSSRRFANLVLDAHLGSRELPRYWVHTERLLDSESSVISRIVSEFNLSVQRLVDSTKKRLC